MTTLFLALLRLLNALRKGLGDEEFRALLALAVFLLLVGAIFYHFEEGWTFLNAAFFSLITLTTVGYGDLVPTTALSKVFTMVYLILGISILFGFLNKIADKMVEERERRARRGHPHEPEAPTPNP